MQIVSVALLCTLVVLLGAAASEPEGKNGCTCNDKKIRTTGGEVGPRETRVFNFHVVVGVIKTGRTNYALESRKMRLDVYKDMPYDVFNRIATKELGDGYSLYTIISASQPSPHSDSRSFTQPIVRKCYDYECLGYGVLNCVVNRFENDIAARHFAPCTNSAEHLGIFAAKDNAGVSEIVAAYINWVMQVRPEFAG